MIVSPMSMFQSIPTSFLHGNIEFSSIIVSLGGNRTLIKSHLSVGNVFAMWDDLN